MTDMRTVVIVRVLVLVFGFSQSINANSEDKVSAPAVSTSKSFGSIIDTREATEEEKRQVKQFYEQYYEQYKELDKSHPAPLQHEELSKLELYKVKSVNRQGIIALENGPDLILEGVRCDPEKQAYIAKMFSSETDRIAFIPTISTEVTPVPAYIWHAGLIFEQAPERKGFVTEPSYSSLNEIALTRGWCVAEKAESNKYFERYRALEKLGRSYVSPPVK